MKYAIIIIALVSMASCHKPTHQNARLLIVTDKGSITDVASVNVGFEVGDTILLEGYSNKVVIQSFIQQ